MREALLDTDILSEVLKRKDARLMAYAIAYVQVFGRFTLSAVTVHEVLYGLVGKGAFRQIREAEAAFARNIVVVPMLADFERAGVIRGEAKRRGRTLSFPDCLVGATAERLGLPVSTGNTGHFRAMVEAGLGIDIEDWRQP